MNSEQTLPNDKTPIEENVKTFEEQDLLSNDGRSLSDGDIGGSIREISLENTTRKSVNGIFYTHPEKLTFRVARLSFTNIPVLKSVSVSFYEKYCILLLQGGIAAGDKNGLTKRISQLLNVREVCIKEFIDWLDVRKLLVHDVSNGRFSLDESVHYYLDASLDGAMFAELDTQKADCDDIVFLDGPDEFFLMEDFDRGAFRRKGVEAAPDIISVPEKVSEAVKGNAETIKSLIVRHFAKTNFHLQKDFGFTLATWKCAYYNIEFDAVCEYMYYPSEKKSVLVGIVVEQENLLPKDFIKSLAMGKVDQNYLPRFIQLDESFYKQIDPSIRALNDAEFQLDEANNAQKPIAVEIQNSKENLRVLRKTHRKEMERVNDEVETVRREIENCEKELADNRTLAQAEENDADLVANYRSTIQELEQQCAQYQKLLAEKTQAIENLKIVQKQAEDDVQNKISEQEEAYRQAGETVRKCEETQKTAEENCRALFALPNVQQEVVKTVLKKYPIDSNVFFRNVCDICSRLDGAVSASESNSFDEVVNFIDEIREKYRKALKVVFDVTLQKNEKTLGSYLRRENNGSNMIAIENMLKKRKIPIDIREKLVTFHELANAIGHSVENGAQKTQNANVINRFKRMSTKERTNLLLAIPYFFSMINLTKKENSDIVEKLKI